ncbi:VOC family protein [Sphingomonas sp. AOB5]|uniref:VOC family protein n=1 Tax=Sphingomonas sp. AOB5 TaxID=3034017 RepID=UPI0023F6410D|nr:VOC family protein [Sphingomonas sp. AOB5]MDF7776402.1 VOC family protein [Sphingomonas sp. AOB5]
MRIKAFHHVRFGVTDLDRTQSFASDFGLHLARRDGDRLWMRSGGGDAFCYYAETGARAFTGLGFLVESMDDLDEAVRLHGAGPIRALEGPGGGSAVTLEGPEGIRVDLVHGITEAAAQPSPPEMRLNFPGSIVRLKDPQHGREMAPPKLFRLGHIGMYVQSFATCAEWFQRVLGLKISDTIHNGDPEQRIVGFLRLDRGDDYVDHHTLFLAQFGKTDCHHISFEVADFEAQFMAHRWLESRGWTPNWGVGRHPLGSHVFDVWFDPDGYRFETFSDTDMVNAGHAAGNHDVHHAQMDLWSSESPQRYFE